MSRQDQIGHTRSAFHHQDLKLVIDWLLANDDLSTVQFRDLCTWSPRGLITAALLWAWSAEATLIDRFHSARSIAIVTLGLDALTATSYQAFLKMLRTWTVVLTAALSGALRHRMRTDLAERFLVAGYVVFACDGSRLELPRTGSNQSLFAAPPKRFAKSRRRQAKAKTARARARAERAEAARQKKADGPQMWLTVMWHVGSGLPWDWRLGPSNSSERDHFRQMIDGLPANALVTADAGFVGYDYWKALLESGRELLIRVGANVRLLKHLGYAREIGNVVYLWPNQAAARREPPLVLRLVVANGGRHPVYLVTSVRDEAVLSDRQVIELYARRWGVELFYRHFKQTFGRRKLRSHRGDNAEVEATWSLLGLWCLSLHAQVELARDGVPSHRVSVAKFLRAYRGAMREYRSRPGPGESLWERLSRAVIDGYTRKTKSSRAYPQKKQFHATGAPKIHSATEFEIELAQQITDEHPSRLTA